MFKTLSALILGALLLAPVPARAESDKDFISKAKNAAGLLFSQEESGGMRMRCTVTAYEKKTLSMTLDDIDKAKGMNVYKFVSAAHCIGEDRKDKELSASTKDVRFFLSFDEEKGAKNFWPARVVWAGYQTRGEDFAVFEVVSRENWPTVDLGDEKTLVDGAEYWNVASPLGLGREVFEGTISKLVMDRPVVADSINWSGAMLLQQAGVNGGSSGSTLISKEQRKIVGFLVGSIAQSQIIAIPVSRFHAVQKAVDAGKYQWWKPEVNIGPDGTPLP